AALSNAGALPAAFPQVVQLGPADVALGDDLELADHRRVHREGPFDPDPVERDLADGERLAEPSALAPDHDALEHLDALAIALDDAHVHLDGVARPELRQVVAQTRRFDEVDLVHGSAT